MAGRAQLRGKGCPFPWLHPGHHSESGPQLGLGGIIALPARGGSDGGAESKGTPPASAPPLLLIKAENKEAAGEGGFDLTPPSQFWARPRPHCPWEEDGRPDLRDPRPQTQVLSFYRRCLVLPQFGQGPK